MAKAKFNAKEFLLRRGEYLVMGASAFFLALMMLWGASKHGTAMDPGKESKKLIDSTKQVYTALDSTTVDPNDEAKLKPPEFFEKPYSFKKASASVFAQSRHPLFDPTAQPSTKRENPLVVPIGEYQVDLVKGAMLGHDITFNAEGEPMIAMLITKKTDGYDENKVKDAAKALKNAVLRRKGAEKKIAAQPKPPAPKGMGGMGMGMGSLGPTPGQKPGGGMPMGPGNPHGLGGTAPEAGGQRVEQAIKYIPLKEIDAAVKAGERPAFTVIPLRLVTVHAVVPYKRQLDEIKRALRLPNPPPTAKKEDIEKSDAEAKRWGPIYDGFEVQRRVIQVINGEEVIIEDWPDTKDPTDTSGNYLFEEKYIDKIDTRSIANHFDEGYIPYFLKPDMMLSMPLPQLTKDLNVKYPDVKLKAITDNIDKLKKANQKEISPSELAKQVTGVKTRSELYQAKTADYLEGVGVEAKKYGPTVGPMGPTPREKPKGMPPTPAVQPKGGGYGIGTLNLPPGYEGGETLAVANEVDNFLLRFVDCDVQPGHIYEYRIRLRMLNPNYGQNDLVAQPEYAKESHKLLYSKWLRLDKRVEVPAESFLYAYDVKAYRDKVNADYLTGGKEASAESRALNAMLQVKENQAVVEVATWTERVRAGEGTKQEPVGTWVVAEMPVGRGELIGRKQYVKLPLWSSESEQYVLREVSDKLVKGKYQPKGWLVNFATTSVLVDFEGGRVPSRLNVRFDDKGNLTNSSNYFNEDVATEMLIVRDDGKLIVRNSLQDEADPTRKSIVADWTKWVDEVAKRKTTPKVDPMNPFEMGSKGP